MSRFHNRRAFTIVELLVVIGIIVLIAGITIPMALKAYSKADATRLRMDLQTVATGLEAYKQNHGDYPRINDYSGTNNYRGAIVLARAMVAPGPAKTSPSPAPGDDGADGPGFRTRGTQGRVYGPYIKPESFRIVSDPANITAGLTDLATPVLIDRVDRAILYFPARAARGDLSVNPGSTAKGPYVGTTSDAMFNQLDNAVLPLDGAPDVPGMRVLLGDLNKNGRIDGTESPKFLGPFILWTAGQDATFGTADDITNFNE